MGSSKRSASPSPRKNRESTRAPETAAEDGSPTQAAAECQAGGREVIPLLQRPWDVLYLTFFFINIVLITYIVDIEQLTCESNFRACRVRGSRLLSLKLDSATLVDVLSRRQPLLSMLQSPHKWCVPSCSASTIPRHARPVRLPHLAPQVLGGYHTRVRQCTRPTAAGSSCLVEGHHLV